MAEYRRFISINACIEEDLLRASGRQPRVVARRDHLHGRAIDFHEGDKVNANALKALIRAAVALNSSSRK